MFEQFEERMRKALQPIQKKGKIYEEDVEQVLRSVRQALLESDVHFRVVKSFIAELKPKLVGQEIQASIDPAQAIVRFVFEELVRFLGGKPEPFYLPKEKGSVILLAGLQGAGKTTTAAKLALFLKKKGYKPFLVGYDRKRYAADIQLKKLADQIQVPVAIAEGLERLPQTERATVYIVDTAGRLHIDKALMEELKELKNYLQPDHLFFVADALTGQDIVRQIESFSEVNPTGIILTKMDGDTRGGAALSLKFVTGLPVFFVGTGEKLGDLQPFYPERVARRMLGMGDLLTLLEKAEASIDQQEMERLERKLKKGEFTLEDFRRQFRLVKRMGSFAEIASLLGFRLNTEESDQGEKELKKFEAMINSMTLEEKQNPAILNASRKRRIARGSGRTVQEVNMLLKQFELCKDLVKKIGVDKPILLQKFWR